MATLGTTIRSWKVVSFLVIKLYCRCPIKTIHFSLWMFARSNNYRAHCRSSVEMTEIVFIQQVICAENVGNPRSWQEGSKKQVTRLDADQSAYPVRKRAKLVQQHCDFCSIPLCEEKEIRKGPKGWL